jgi:hypothetical protein
MGKLPKVTHIVVIKPGDSEEYQPLATDIDGEDQISVSNVLTSYLLRLSGSLY